jgi:hypothetical protein
MTSTPWRKNCQTTSIARRCGAPGMAPTHKVGRTMTVVQIALTDTFSTAQPVETPSQRFQVFLQLVCRECLKVRYPPVHFGGEGRFARRTL